MTRIILTGLLAIIISSCGTKKKAHSEAFIKTQNEFHKLYQYKDINDIYIPKNYKKILKGIVI
jgi:hypothetical protein